MSFKVGYGRNSATQWDNDRFCPNEKWKSILMVHKDAFRVTASKSVEIWPIQVVTPESPLLARALWGTCKINVGGPFGAFW